MSRRLAALNFVLRVAVKPRLARTRGPEQAAREFVNVALHFDATTYALLASFGFTAPWVDLDFAF